MRTLPCRPNNIAELIALAKQKPGEITYGSSGLGAAGHVNVALLESMAGIKMAPVHYRGATPALNDVLAGHIMLTSVSLSASVPPYRAGKAKMLAVGSLKRLPQLPEVPATAETVPGYEAVTWFGLFTTAGTPREIIGKINAEVRALFDDPAFRERAIVPNMFETMVSLAGTVCRVHQARQREMVEGAARGQYPDRLARHAREQCDEAESLWRSDISSVCAVWLAPLRHKRRPTRRAPSHSSSPPRPAASPTRGARRSASGCRRNGASRSSSRTRAAARTSSARSRWRMPRPTATRVMLAEAGTFVINPNLYPKDKLPIDIEKDFIPITGLVRIHHSVMVAPNMPVNSVAELIALAQAEARRDQLRHRRRRLRPACQRRALRERRQGQAQRHPLSRRDTRRRTTSWAATPT